MRYLVLPIVFLSTASAIDWNRYASTYSKFGDFWKHPNTYHESKTFAQCGDVFNKDSKFIIAACQDLSGPYVRVGCLTDGVYAVFQAPCPNGSHWCTNTEANDTVYADCS